MSAHQRSPGNTEPKSGIHLDVQNQPRRLWAPWRLKYIAQNTGEDGCIFCSRLASEDDTRSLILRRAKNAFVIMNLFPYNTGHVMIVPNRHVADPSALSPEELSALGSLLPDVLASIRRAMNPAGFNVGTNIGAVAGAGVADHLHQHVVPRWQGDANFMPIIAGVMVMPELIPATYAKIRAEFERSSNQGETNATTLVILNREASKVVITKQGTLPSAKAAPGEPIHRSAANFLHSIGIVADLVGWAGLSSTKQQGRGAFAYLASTDEGQTDEVKWISIDSALDRLTDNKDRDSLRSALNLDLTIAIAPPD